ncbi:MAG: transglutaminase-like domain-containing protein, partial [Ignavibacteriaceae bacterium]|nr:transglutaminase-like domain-containing protein [Ignavibacteriaceae bacterium]
TNAMQVKLLTKSILLVLIFLFSSILSAQTNISELNSLINSGEFSTAAEKIDSLILFADMSVEEAHQLQFQKDKLERIKKDFKRTEEYVTKALLKYYPSINKDMLKQWEDDGSLEMKIIDGEKRYFNNAVPNLFRVNKKAKQKKIEVDGTAEDKLKLFLSKHIPQSVEQSLNSGSTTSNLKKIKINYTLTVDADVVPKGEIIRAWLPYPRNGYDRQSDINLLHVNSNDYIISPDSYLHKSIYIEKPSEGDKPTVFNIALEYTCSSQWFNLSEDKVKPYNKTTELYKEFTSERTPHIVFSNKIKNLAAEIIGNEKNPYNIVKKIAVWINDNIPWASAREYSTLENISDYCITNMHGDCGIKSLLFITLARCSGVPAKWQSGWMMHPPVINLHDWTEVYFEGYGWVPVDPDFGIQNSDDEKVKYFYTNGLDSYRLIVNDDISRDYFPAKIYPRSETVDFQRGEVEWR